MFFTNTGQVLASAEFHRISALPRRNWKDCADALVDPLSELLKAPNGTMKLRPVQAIALKEFWECGGLFGSMSVSSGKTLTLLLFGRICNAERIVLMAPAKLHGKKGSRKLSKTRKEIQELSKHWIFPPVTLLNYETLGTVSNKDELEKLSPTLLLLDEVHKLRNPKAARTKRVKRYLKEHPDCKVCALSGTTIKRSIKDYAHIMKWCLGVKSPCPIQSNVLDEWSQALDEKLEMGLGRIAPGALLEWCEPGEVEEYGELRAARRAYARRIEETPGVICFHVGTEHLDVPLSVTEIVPQYPEGGAIDSAFEQLRRWELPDGQELVEGCEIYRHAREIALGFYYKWKFPAPKLWLEKRKAWFSWVRGKLSTSRTYDSPDDVAQAFPNQQEWLDWKGIRKSYEPETTLVWLDTSVLQLCVDWLKENEGIVFVEHSQFGEALASVAGVPYFGAGGEDRFGRSIEVFEGRRCVASIKANDEGRNLHLRRNGEGRIVGYDKMLITSPPPNGPGWEQLLGREHRQGTDAESVQAWVLIGCKEQLSAFTQAVHDAENAARDLNGEEPKLCLAEIEVEELDDRPKAYCWDNRAKEKKKLTLPWEHGK